MHILRLRVIGALWIIEGFWLGWGVMRQAWSDASEGHHRADELLLTAFFVTFSALAVCAAFGVLRDRRWAIWTLRVVGSLVLLDTLCYFIMCDFAWDALAALAFAIITLMGLMFVKRHEQVV